MKIKSEETTLKKHFNIKAYFSKYSVSEDRFKNNLNARRNDSKSDSGSICVFSSASNCSLPKFF